MVYSVPNPFWLSDRFVYTAHDDFGTVYVKLNCEDEIEEIGTDISKRMHNTPLEDIAKLQGHRLANEVECNAIDFIGEEYWCQINKQLKDK